MIMHGVYRAVLSRMNSNGKGKTYFYRFDLQSDLNWSKKMYNLSEDGAGHGDDVVSIPKAFSI
jgi:hypothetical protein